MIPRIYHFSLNSATPGRTYTPTSMEVVKDLEEIPYFSFQELEASTSACTYMA